MSDSASRISDLIKERRASVRSLNSNVSKSSKSIKSRYTHPFHKLCATSSYVQIRELLPTLNRSVLLDRQGLHKWTPLMILCVRAPVDIIQMLIQHTPEACFIADTSKSLPLHFVACWRRDGEEEHVLKAMIGITSETKRQQIEITNQWGQNPLHAAFDSKECPSFEVVNVLLGMDQPDNAKNKELDRLHQIADDPDGITTNKNLSDRESDAQKADESSSRKAPETREEIKQPLADASGSKKPQTNGSGENQLNQQRKKLSTSVLIALSTPDSKSRLPLHIACKNGASHQLLQLLVTLYPDACTTQTNQNELPLHLYYEFLNTPLGKKKRDMAQNKAQACMELLIAPILSNYKDSKFRKKSRGVLPIHIACELGLSYDLISRLCKAYPKGVSKVKPGTSKYPLELFLLSKAHEQALSAKYHLESLTEKEVNSPTYQHLHDTIAEFHKTSDILFAYYPEAVPSEKSGIKLFRKDLSRITRLEDQIRKEALDKNVKELSTTSRLVWIWMCHFTNPNDPKDVYVSSVGRVIDNLDSSSLWKLTFVKNSGSSARSFVKVGGPSGKTVIMEAEKRALRTTYNDLLRISHKWQNQMLRYLSPKDALSYSCICRHTYVTGVKYLMTKEDLGDGRWESTHHPKPWKQLDLVIPECTHSIELSYRLTEFQKAQGDQDSQKDITLNGTTASDKSKKLWHGPGLKVFKRTEGQAFSKKSEPFVENLVRVNENRTHINDTETDIRISFTSQASFSYELWYYLPDSTSFITVTNSTMKQLLYCRNSEKRTPIFSLLSSKFNEADISEDEVNSIKKVTTLFHTTFPPFHMSPFHSLSISSKNKKANYNVDSCILHFGIKCNVSLKVLKAIISLNPRALVEVDENGRTPLHIALLQQDVSFELVKLLILTTPGENACRCKDSSGRLPLHIATKNGVSEPILKVLVRSYADGCYRQNKEGDLPVHLLERSGKANTSTLELLIQPIMGNESICRIEGSQGCDLSLHIAARYNCSFEIIEKLLRTYSDAASRLCKRKGYEDASALCLFEEGRKKMIQDMEARVSVATKKHIVEEFNQRSDLLFVYNPMLSPTQINKNGNDTGVKTDAKESKSNSNLNGVSNGKIHAENQSTVSLLPYRKDEQRISRLATLIIKEAKQVSEGTIVNGKKKTGISDTARLAWIWMTTYENEEEEEDYFTNVKEILNNLSSPALKVLAFVEWNGKLIKDCAISKCKQLIINGIRFVGRYEWSELEFPLHKSDTCLIMRAKDHYVVEEYTEMKKNLEDNAAAFENGSDDLSSNQDIGIPLETFLEFCYKLGLTEKEAKRELRKKHKNSRRESTSMGSIKSRPTFGLRSIEEVNEEQQEDDEVDEYYMEGEQHVNAATFENFCKSNGLDDRGVRRVVVKFMLYRQQFEREKAMREKIGIRGADWPVVPILEDYNVDRMEYSSKDALYAKDIQDKDESTYDMFRYKYALVLVGADRDLGEISVHESPDIIQTRDYMKQVGSALRVLHDHSVIHGDLRMSNIVRFNSKLALIDLDSSYSQPTLTVGKSPVIYFGGSSHRFSSGMMPPEMLAKIELPEKQVLLDRYEFYWKNVSEDARDLDLLTPDDICNIASVLKTIAMTHGNDIFRKGASDKISEDGTHSLPSKTHTYASSILPNDITIDSKQDWKSMISMALITISFSDLPHSLTSCNSIAEFSDVWNKLLSNAELWRQVQPHKCKDGNVYLIKAFLQTEDAPNTLPYNLVEATEKFDIWAFGVLIFAMCAKGHLFSLDHEDNLVDSDSYAELYNWDKKTAQKIIDERVDDPLAQDLLLQILVPHGERLDKMELVLSHPFFGSSSGIEAQRILEKHEEQQLMFEETAVISQMTSETLLRLQNSTESQCKLIFEEEKIVVPTSLVILPYELEVDKDTGALMAPDDPAITDLAIEIGKHLLDINKTTARLSFWLMMKKKTSSSFKDQLKEWLTRAKKGTEVDIVAEELCNEIGCGNDYIDICREMLMKGEAVTHSRKFFKEPMGHARILINKSIESLVKCYASHQQYLYLVDEFYGVPAAPDDISRTNYYLQEGDEEGPVYPINVDPNTRHFQNLFVPFLNITVMNVTAIDGFSSLARLLGLSPSRGIPDSWIDTVEGLIHKDSNPATVAEFAVLQDLIRKESFHSPSTLSSFRSMESTQTGLSEWDETLIEVGSEMLQLEIFFREYDPLRIFSALRRIAGPQKNDLAIWTTEDVVRKILEEIEQAKLEMKLTKLKKDYYQSHGYMDEIIVLNKQLQKLRAKGKLNNISDGSHLDKADVSVASSMASSKRRKMRNTVKSEKKMNNFFLGFGRK